MIIADATDKHVDKIHYLRGWKTLIYPKGFTLKMDNSFSEVAELVPNKDDVQKQQSSWSGPQDGLPPVGERVDYMGEHCTVVAHVIERNEKGAILQGADDWFYGTEITIDPIRTAADIAAEQRETAIADMAKVLPRASYECYSFNDDGSVKPYQRVRMILELLVDAGFKREVV